MSSYEETKTWLISQKDNIGRKNFRDYIDKIVKNYFSESQEDISQKFKNFNELLNIVLRFVGPWSSNGFKYSKQVLGFPENIEQIDREFIRSNANLFNLLGFKMDKLYTTYVEILPQLVDFGLYHSRLSSYSEDVQASIISTILIRVKDPNWHSYYLSLSLYKEENFEIFKKSLQLRDLFPEIIEQIDSELIRNNTGLFSILGCNWKKKKPTFAEVTSKLVDIGFYDSRLSSYSEDVQASIISTILSRLKPGRWFCYYLSLSPHKEENKIIFKNSPQFREFLRKKKNKTIKTFLKKYDFSENILKQEMKFSSLSAPWSDANTERLIRLYDENPEALINQIKTTDIAIEIFGRSKNSVLAQLNILINGESISKGSGKEISSRGSFVPEKVLKDYYSEFLNYSELHSNNSLLREFPVLSYIYPYDKPFTEDSCFVFILSLKYKGVSINNYRSFEKQIISRLYSKLVDINSEELIEVNKILEIKLEKNFVSKFFSDNTSLVGLYVRKKFSLNNNIPTCEVPEELVFEGGTRKFNYWILKE